jgi:hypothetical protein
MVGSSKAEPAKADAQRPTDDIVADGVGVEVDEEYPDHE